MNPGDIVRIISKTYGKHISCYGWNIGDYARISNNIESVRHRSTEDVFSLKTLENVRKGGFFNKSDLIIDHQKRLNLLYIPGG
jgi:hypothetical protein